MIIRLNVLLSITYKTHYWQVWKYKPRKFDSAESPWIPPKSRGLRPSYWPMTLSSIMYVSRRLLKSPIWKKKYFSKALVLKTQIRRPWFFLLPKNYPGSCKGQIKASLLGAQNVLKFWYQDISLWIRFVYLCLIFVRVFGFVICNFCSHV